VKSNQPIRGIWRWLRNQIVQDVPEDSALCEFDCRKGQCTTEEWEGCDRRLNKAAGELMPSPKKPPLGETDSGLNKSSTSDGEKC